MRIFLSLLIGLLCWSSIVISAQAASFGLSPAMIDLKMTPGSSQDLKFTVIGYTGKVDISLENMSAVSLVSSSSVQAISGSDITVTVKCRNDALLGTYNGRMVFLAKSGSSVQSGIKVVCNLIVVATENNVILQSGDSSSGSVSSSLINDERKILVVSSGDSASGGVSIPISSSEISETKNDVVKSDFNFIFFGLVVLLGLVCVGAFFVGYRWMQRRKKF